MYRTHETLEAYSITVEPLAPEIVEFCALLARIIHRCVQQQDPRILSLLGISVVPTVAQHSEVIHEHAA